MVERVAIGNNVILIHGDCGDVLPDLSSEMAAVFDPPYGIGHFKGSSGAVVAGRKSLRRSSKRIVGDDRPFDPSIVDRFAFRLMWGANHYAGRLPGGGRWLGWDKTGGGRGPKDSFSDLELAWASAKGNAKLFHYLWKGVCQDGEKGEKRHHPTQKPIALMEWCINFTPDGMSILDPYMGAGSTGIAAVRAGRPFVGIEIDREHFEKSCTRISAEVDRQSRLSAAA